MASAFPTIKAPWIMAITAVVLLGLVFYVRRELNQHASAIIDLRRQVHELNKEACAAACCPCPCTPFPAGPCDEAAEQIQVFQNEDIDDEDEDEDDDDDCISVDSNQLRNILDIIHEEEGAFDPTTDLEPESPPEPAAPTSSPEAEPAPEHVPESAPAESSPAASQGAVDYTESNDAALSEATPQQLREFLTNKGVACSRLGKDVLVRKIQALRPTI